MDLIEYTRQFTISKPITSRTLNPLDKRNNKTKFQIVWRDPNKGIGKIKKVTADTSIQAIKKFRDEFKNKLGAERSRPQDERAYKFPQQEKDANKYLDKLNRTVGNDKSTEQTERVRLQRISK